MQVVEELDVSPAVEEGGEGGLLAGSEFHGEQAAGAKSSVGLGDEAAVEVEAVGAGEEGGGGFEVADLGVECGAVGVGDVGRVREDGVEGLGAGGKGGEEIALEESDAIGDVVARGVLAGEVEGGGGEIEGGDAGLRQV